MTVEVRNENGEIVIEMQPFWKKRRYLLAVLNFFGFINLYTLRTFCFIVVQLIEQDFWRDLVMSGFFYGYILTQVNLLLVTLNMYL